MNWQTIDTLQNAAQSKPLPRLPPNVADQGAAPDAAPAEPAKILILAMGKSGTTILYQILKESLPDDAVCLFEPTTCQPEDSSALRDKNVLSKVLILPPNDCDHYSPQACAFFNRRIFLKRDPRDLLVSQLLYRSYQTAITSDFWRFAQFCSALRAKEQDPGSVSLLDLLTLEAHLSVNNDGLPLSNAEQVLETLQFSLDVAGLHNDGVFHLKYEDLVDRRLGPLEQYLGFPLAQVDQVDAQFQRVTRTKAYGDWRNWFLPEDVAYFKPRLAKYMQASGYADDWELPDRPVISAENASGYLMRLAEERGLFRSIDYGADAFPPENNIRVDPSLEFWPHLIPNLRPKASEAYPNRGAVIRDPHVETADGRRVNVLAPGDRYVYKYEVLFISAVRNVSCWMALVDQRGQTIVSNGTAHHFRDYESIAKGCLLQVEFEYVCQQPPGVYFLNAGVMTSEAGGTATYAHRIVGATLIVVRLARAELAAGPPRVVLLNDQEA